MKPMKTARGPWVVGRVTKSGNRSFIPVLTTGYHAGPVCEVRPCDLGKTEWRWRRTKANAHLIAAAPSMLEALEQVLPYMESAEAAGLIGDEGCHWPVELVRAAIAEAKEGLK